MKKQNEAFLDSYQIEAVEKLHSGNILVADTGAGKSRTAIYWYFKENKGEIVDDIYTPMIKPKDLYIITTANKRDSLDWERELIPFHISTKNSALYPGLKVTIDSWNCIKKYVKVKDAYFIFDEDHLVTFGEWTKAFLKISVGNQWIVATATPGDTYEQYAPIMVANGYYKSKWDFLNQHAVITKYGGYPKISRYIETKRLDKIKQEILVEMNYHNDVVINEERVICKYNIDIYRIIMRDRWNPFDNKPVENASQLCYLLRRCSNDDISRVRELKRIQKEKQRLVVFYSFDYELDILRNIDFGEQVKVAELNGHKHEPVPVGAEWVYLVNYGSGAEAWNCITTDTMIFFSQTYSYKTLIQAKGRINRRNTPYKELFYYHFVSKSPIDRAITDSLKRKKEFNETKYIRKFNNTQQNYRKTTTDIFTNNRWANDTSPYYRKTTTDIFTNNRWANDTSPWCPNREKSL